MKVGDYVRTNNGDIGILTKVFNEGEFIIDTYPDEVRYDCIKSSPNIIDLIEVGDYVNGCYVDEIIGANDSWDDRQHFHLLKFNSYFGNSDIKSIVTKEMYASVEYRVETN